MGEGWGEGEIANANPITALTRTHSKLANTGRTSHPKTPSPLMGEGWGEGEFSKVNPTTALRCTHSNLSMRASFDRLRTSGNLNRAEHTSANRRCYGDEIATLRSQ